MKTADAFCSYNFGMAVSIPPPTDVAKDIKRIHKRAFEHISKALELDENGAETSSTIEAYRKGVNELKKGIAINIENEDNKSKERLSGLQEKMKKNLVMSLERLQILEEKAKPISTSNTEFKPPVSNSTDKSRPTRPKSAPKASSKPVPPRTSARNIPPTDRFKKNAGDQATPEERSNSASKTRCGKKFRGLEKDLVDRILNEVVEEKTCVSFNDIAGNELAKEALREIVIYPMLRPDLYTGLRSPTRGVLLFGPPGNGKTLLAKAVASESKCVFFNISAASLMSKWVGESEKMVRALFTMARELQPCIIFMDEIDSLLSARKSDDKDVTRRVLNEFLQEFDGARTTGNDQILIMGATNRPFELDDAALRRFPKRIQIRMPDIETRFQLLKLLLRKEGNPLNDKELWKIAQITENYSSSDLTNLAKDAAMGPLRSLDRETFQSISSSEVRKLQLCDFEASLRKVRPTSTPSSLKDFDEWNNKFGDVSC